MKIATLTLIVMALQNGCVLSMTAQFSNNYGECKKLPFNISTMNKHQQRKNQPVFTGVLKYFPDALKAVSECSLAGNTQHHPDKELHWDKSKSFDNEDALVRHLIDHSINPIDDDGMLHLTKCAWRALASLQIYLENNEQ